MSEWQPIETAPKDGTSILVFRPGEGVAETRWGGFGEFTDGGLDRGWVNPWDHGWFWDLHPTHWMPLPEPPSPVKQSAADND